MQTMTSLPAGSRRRPSSAGVSESLMKPGGTGGGHGCVGVSLVICDFVFRCPPTGEVRAQWKDVLDPLFSAALRDSAAYTAAARAADRVGQPRKFMIHHGVNSIDIL